VKHRREQSPACALPQLLPDLSSFRKIKIARTVSVKFDAFEPSFNGTNTGKSNKKKTLKNDFSIENDEEECEKNEEIFNNENPLIY
jgi:hypothetical protein